MQNLLFQKASSSLSTRVKARPVTINRRARAPSANVGAKTRHVLARAEGADGKDTSVIASSKPEEGREAEDPLKATGKGKRQADTTDWVATQLTRRFGIAGGLAWFAFLAIGSLGEQVKTRLEVAREKEAARDVDDASEVTLPSGVSYRDLRIGGGQSPQKGYLVVLDFKLTVAGDVIDDTYERRKPVVFFWGTKPYAGGMNAGLEEVVSTMRAGGKRRCVIPAQQGFGDQAYVIRPTNHAGDKGGVVPANSTLEYDVELVRVSSPPS